MKLKLRNNKLLDSKYSVNNKFIIDFNFLKNSMKKEKKIIMLKIKKN